VLFDTRSTREASPAITAAFRASVGSDARTRDFTFFLSGAILELDRDQAQQDLA
jgi:hypothetical protein